MRVAIIQVAQLLTPKARGEDAGAIAGSSRLAGAIPPRPLPSSACLPTSWVAVVYLCGSRETGRLTGDPFCPACDDSPSASQLAVGASVFKNGQNRYNRPVTSPSGGTGAVGKSASDTWAAIGWFAGSHSPGMANFPEGYDSTTWFQFPGSAPPVGNNSGEAEFNLLGPLTAEDFAAAWQVDVRVRIVQGEWKFSNDSPRKLVVPSIDRTTRPCCQRAPSCPPMASEGSSRKRWHRPVSFDSATYRAFEAIEEVCRQVGIYPDYSFMAYPNSMAFIAGKRPWPVALCGPFLWEVTALEEDPLNAAGTLTLNSWRTDPVPPKVIACRDPQA